ncbi:MAG: AAA family ATPase [Ktedonobacteraceae bacterium]|nr:AAA family ATPase [Ktedonobacteraceae bacterium]
MKTVLKEPTLVLMAGLPGVGKSTLAFRLGQLLGWVVIEKDNLKEPFLEDPVLKEKIDEETAGWAAYDSFLKIAEDILLNQHLSVILDSSALHPFILKRAKELVACSGANFKPILCDVDEPTRQDRLRTRPSRISQSEAHRIPREAFEQFDNLPEDTLRVCTKTPLKNYESEVLAYVTEQEVATLNSHPAY